MRAKRIVMVRRVSQAMVNHRWVFIIGLGILSILADLGELLFSTEARIDFQFASDIFIHGFLVPLLVWILLDRLDRSEQKRSLGEKQLELQKSLANRLNQSNSWNDLVETVIEFPRVIFPYIGAYLWIFTPDSHQFVLEAGWGFTGINPPNPPVSPVVNSSPSEAADHRPDHNQLTSRDFERQTVQDDSPDLVVHCIPFIHQNQPVALLYCYLPASYKMTEAHQLLIDYISPTIAIALYEAKVNDPELLQARAVNAERSRIAKNLHDSLAQDLAYLLHELEYYSNSKYRDLVQLVTVQDELIKMRDIADQAYTEIRTILDNLELENKRNLASILLDYSRSYQSRTRLEVNFEQAGIPRNLPKEVVTQVFTIFREILANINFHAHAHQVDIRLVWLEDHASLLVADDGQGFDPAQPGAAGHYGLNIMQHRALEISGQLSITSAPGAGARVQLIFPLQSLSGPIKSQSFRWLNSAIDQTLLQP